MSSHSDWRKYFPYEQPREIQAEALDVLFSNWNKYDIFVLSAPTAFGKTGLARTLMNAYRSASIITPTNLLVDQFREEFPNTPTLRRLDAYECDTWMRGCATTRGKLLSFCKGGVCPASRDLAVAKYQRGPGVYNYHIYLAHKLHREVLVVDEAHNLIPVIRDRLALRLWQHDYKYPNNMYTTEQMVQFLETLPESKRAGKKVRAWWDSVRSGRPGPPEYMPQRVMEEFNGKGTERGRPELRDCLKLIPVDISSAPPMFWPRETVRKIVLLSATISQKDVEMLGLGGRRVLHIRCESPIPATHRPILVHPLTSVNRNNLVSAAVAIGKHITQVLAPRHLGEKGIIHATYQFANLLRPHLSDSRYMFHDRTNRKDQYRAFRESPSSEGRVLVASGMYEGIDLPEDLGRWQVIAKVPWPSLGSPALKFLAENDEEYYDWETVRTVIQACGRICRTPEDFGTTYILDSSMRRLIDGPAWDLFPPWWQEAVRYVSEED